MYLDYLKIFRGSEEIRNIPFKRGANFIVDKTPFTKGTESGNNVGKTTLLRLIDYCLGSNGKDIYSDTEFREAQNTELKNYLQENNYLVELSLIDDGGENKTVIRRNFLSRSKKLITVNDEVVSEDDFKLKLKLLLFDYESGKPSYRNLLSKFVRDTPHRMSNTLRFLHNTTTNAVYESVHLFLFGVRFSPDKIEEKLWLESKITSETNVLNRVTEDGNSENALKQALILINRDISNLEKQKEKFNVGESEKDDIDELNNLKYEVSKLSAELGENETKFKLVHETLYELEKGFESFDKQVIKDIYNEAKFYVPSLQKRFEEVVDFHNSMLKNKMIYISKDIPEIERAIKHNKELISLKVKRENELSFKLNKLFKIEEYDGLIRELNRRYELKGNKEERYKQVLELRKSIEEKTKDLEIINEELDKLEPKLEKNINKFNEFFSTYSKVLYDEEFYVSYEKSNGNYKFNIMNIEANVGGGKKKGQIAAFDLAYIKFCESMGIKSPKFVLHDSTEDVSINQLMIINEIANNVDGQYVLSILSDKFSGNKESIEVIDFNKVVELSQADKLFKF